MEFTIGQNSSLPLLKLQVVKDGISDYNSMMEFIERSSIFFSMVDTTNGIPKINTKVARFVEKLGMNVNASAEYYVYYRFTEQDTSRVGRYEGQFVFINDTGTLVLPIRERLYINIEESYIANDLPYNNCYVLDYNCCVTPFPSPAPTQTPYPVLSPTPTNTPTPTPTSSPSAIPLILGLFVTVDPGSIIINYNLVANQVVDQEVTMNFTHVLPVISGDPIVVMTGVTISINNTSGNTVVLLTENYYDLLREDLFGNVVVIPSTAQWEIFENYPTTPTPTPIPTNTPTPTVTPTPTPTNTPTPTVTPTPTPTSVIEILINPLIVGNDEYLNVGDEEYLEFVDPI